MLQKYPSNSVLGYDFDVFFEKYISLNKFFDLISNWLLLFAELFQHLLNFTTQNEKDLGF